MHIYILFIFKLILSKKFLCAHFDSFLFKKKQLRSHFNICIVNPLTNNVLLNLIVIKCSFILLIKTKQYQTFSFTILTKLGL